MNQNKCFIYGIVIVLLSFFSFMTASSSFGAPTKEQIEQQKADIQKMANDTLERLYKAQPKSRNVIAKAAGYAVFSNFGMKIFLAGGGSGKGLAVD